ncbi:phytoene desaturase family protein [Clostridium sp.]|uniref:phytoene desaturase family protein n=1 Tax=Clostridium sp. TaxID=1506 RepID=UPI003D6CEA75
MRKKIIIVGAGVGGLATAVRMLSRGYEVKIYEKEKRIGGKVNIIEEDDFRFDLTASILMRPEEYKEVFSFANKNWEDYLQFISVDPIYRVNYADGSRYDFSRDLVKLIETLESISKPDSVGYLKFLGDSYEKYLIANKYFLNKSFIVPKDFFNPLTMSMALKSRTLSNTYNYVSKYIKNEKLREFLCFQALYVGISPFNGPNIYTIVPTISELYGVWHLKGGMYSYIKALEKLIYELGGTIETETNIEEILILDGVATGIKTSNKIEKSDIVICNADFPYAVTELIKDKKDKGEYDDEKVSKMKYSCSTFIMYLGLNKKYPRLQVHNLFLGEDFKKNVEAPFEGKLPEKPSLYIYCPSRIDETMAPIDKENLNIMVRVPNLLFEAIHWDVKLKGILRKQILETLSRISGLEDVEEHIIYENYLTPKDLKDSFNSYGGTAFGLSHTLTQTNYFRPHLKLKEVKNLYFVGSSVHPGTGVSMVLISSKLVAEEVLRCHPHCK